MFRLIMKAMGYLGCKLVGLYSAFLRRRFQTAGLTSQFVAVDDETTVHCWVSAFDSRKPALVMVHGFGPSAVFQWRHQVKPLSHHFSLFIPDILFFGRSTTRSEERSEVFQATCLRKMLDRLGVGLFSVVGTSYGGFVAYQLALMCGRRVQRVVVASSAVNLRRNDGFELLHRANMASVRDLMLPATAAHLRTLMRLSIFRQPCFIPDFLLTGVVQKIYKRNYEEKGQLLGGLTLGMDDELHIKTIEQDVMIIWGEHDQIFPIEKAYELKRILGANVSMEIIKDTSHIPQIENPKKFNDIIKRYLRSLPISSNTENMT